MRVFLTGGNGFIGSAVVRSLASQGHECVLLLRDTSDTSRLEGTEYESVRGDVRDRDSLARGMVGCDAVIHLASPSAWDVIDSPEMPDIVLGGTRNVLSAARQSGDLRVVFVSSVAAVDGTAGPEVLDESAPYNLAHERGLVYSQMKHQAEALCAEAAEAGQPVIIVNPAEVYGPNDTGMLTAGTLVDFATSSPVVVCEGGTSIVHVDDVARGIILATERGKPGERYILGGDNLTVRQLANHTLELLGKKRRVMNVPRGVLRFVARAAVALRVPMPFNPKVIPYATRYWFVSNEKARRELGAEFRPAREVLEPTLAWLQKEGHI